MRKGEDYLSSIKLKSESRFRDIGFMFAYIVFNYLLYVGLYYLMRVHNWKSPSKMKQSRAQPSAPQEDNFPQQEGLETKHLNASEETTPSP